MTKTGDKMGELSEPYEEDIDDLADEAMDRIAEENADEVVNELADSSDLLIYPYFVLSASRNAPNHGDQLDGTAASIARDAVEQDLREAINQRLSDR